MTVVYFDTCAWSHLYNGAVLMRPAWQTVATPADLSKLRQAVSSGTISILLSMVALEELISLPENYQARAKLALDLSDWRRPIKPTVALLDQAIRAYAAGARLPAPIFTGPQQWEIVKGLSSMVLGSTPQDIAARQESNKLARQQIAGFYESMVRGQQQTRKVMEQNPDLYDNFTFENYWAEVNIRFAEVTARQLGVLDQCRARGIAGLLEIPCVRMAVGISASLMFAQVQKKTFQKPQPQDSRDLQHAVMAAARASVFVTDDGKLARLVRRVPMTGFETLRLSEFLARL